MARHGRWRTNTRNWSREAWRWFTGHPWLAIALILLGIGLWAFIDLAHELREGEVLPVDLRIFALLQPYRTPWLQALAFFFSDLLFLPYIGFILAPFVIYLLSTRRYLMGIALVGIPLGALLVVGLLKVIFHRPRPATALIYQVGASFPSGHAVLSTVIYGLIAYVSWRYLVQSRWARWLIIYFAVIFIVATGLSRIYLEVHYPSDVLGGWLAGGCILFGSIILMEARRRGRLFRHGGA